MEQARDDAGDDFQAAAGRTGGSSGNRAHEPLGVRVKGVAEQIHHIGFLDHPPGVHDHDLFGGFGDDSKIVRDQQNGGAGASSKVLKSRIWAWIVTSRAVVGSSAMISLGPQARAMAIITRWRMPPLIWCG